LLRLIWRWRRNFGDGGATLATAAQLWRWRRNFGDGGGNFGDGGATLATAAQLWRRRRNFGDGGARFGVCRVSGGGRDCCVSKSCRAIKMDPTPILPIARPYGPHSFGSKSGVEPRPNTISLLPAALLSGLSVSCECRRVTDDDRLHGRRSDLAETLGSAHSAWVVFIPWFYLPAQLKEPFGSGCRPRHRRFDGCAVRHSHHYLLLRDCV